MGALTVGSLALSLHLPDGAQPRAGAVRKVVERQFLPAVLDALAGELDAAYGAAAVIRIRNLRLRLRIGPEIRDAAGLARQIGQDLAAHIRDIAVVAQPRADPLPAEAEVRIWPTPGAWHGAALIAALRHAPGPEGRIDTLPALAGKLLDEPAEVAAETLVHCAEAGVLDAVISGLPPPVLHRLAARCAAALPAAIRAKILAVVERTGTPHPGHQADADPAQDPPAYQQPTEHAEPTRPLRDGMPPQQHSEDHAPILARPPGSAPHPDASPGPSMATNPSAARAAEIPVPHRPADPPAPHSEESVPTRRTIPDRDTTPLPERTHTEAEAPSAALPTCWGGLAYLVTLAMRLGMPEALWRIGVAEGAALSAMLATISGAPDDPTSAALAPEFPRRPAPLGPVPDWARHEFCATVTAAARALAGADVPPRIETCRAALAEDGAWHLPEWAAAVLIATLESLIGRPLDTPALTALLGITGEVEVGPRLIRVRLPPEAVDFDIRRAGLDADPGLLPWLDKRLVVAFGSAEEDWAG
ncbi:hypothetical protein [Paracoccus sp. DMF]|uniref:hypothetical protein n=1 Tax=Paracoccus sp. DMF TaxID=400837 RepID=UPI0021E39BC4|nr:hypothetical protein [Paracoccus sp. DMF]MCV2446171.1 hypothetical protein [Paracoccus sp. DMF]